MKEQGMLQFERESLQIQSSNRDVSFHVWTMLKRRPAKPVIHIVVSNTKPNNGQELISELANVVKEFKSFDQLCRYAVMKLNHKGTTSFTIQFVRIAMTWIRCSHGDLTAVQVWNTLKHLHVFVLFKFLWFLRL